MRIGQKISKIHQNDTSQIIPQPKLRRTGKPLGPLSYLEFVSYALIDFASIGNKFSLLQYKIISDYAG